MGFYKAYDAERTCQYLGEDLGYEYFISNEGNFAGHDGASYEAYFEPVNYRGFKAFVESEAPDSGEFFVWFSMEDYITMKDGQTIITVKSMMQMVKDHPLIDFLYVYDLAAGATDFFADAKGLDFTDALGNPVRLLDDSDYVFYVDGLSVKIATPDKHIMYAPDYDSKTTLLETDEE